MVPPLPPTQKTLSQALTRHLCSEKLKGDSDLHPGRGRHTLLLRTHSSQPVGGRDEGMTPRTGAGLGIIGSVSGNCTPRLSAGAVMLTSETTDRSGNAMRARDPCPCGQRVYADIRPTVCEQSRGLCHSLMPTQGPRMRSHPGRAMRAPVGGEEGRTNARSQSEGPRTGAPSLPLSSWRNSHTHLLTGFLRSLSLFPVPSPHHNKMAFFKYKLHHLPLPLKILS